VWFGLRILLETSKRSVDILISAALLLALSPLLAVCLGAALLGGGGLSSEARLGRHNAVFRLYRIDFGRFRTLRALRYLPSLCNVLRGDLSVVGPRPLACGETKGMGAALWQRSGVRPGLCSLWWVRQRANIGFDGELRTDLEYVDTRSLHGDFGIALRALGAALLGGGEAPVGSSRVHILGVAVDNKTLGETVDEVARLAQERPPASVYFVNADCLNIAFRDSAYRDALAASRLTMPDGIGLKIAGRILRRAVRQNVNGTDLFPRLCSSLERSGGSLYLLGGRPGVAEAVAAWVGRNHRAVRVCGVRDGYFSPAEEPEVVEEIARSGASVLLVALGAPRQELWIRRHLERLNVGVAIGVGGLFDFYSGRIARAPQWMRELGLEWFYRFLQEPGRMWRRYFLGNALFVWRVLGERLGAGLARPAAIRKGGIRT
jgi:N-acetylglucosaminyldiphosphoundecaprenol N-acetyl-beta-D-mannosaminyltransferase